MSYSLPYPKVHFVPDPAISSLNERNRKQWDLWTVETNELVENDINCKLALADLGRCSNEFEFRRYSFLKSLRQAWENRKIVLQAQAKGARQARTPDLFQELCASIVDDRPNISLREFVEAIKSHKHLGVVDDFDDKIILVSLPGKTLREVKICALKNRLHRLKTSYRSR